MRRHSGFIFAEVLVALVIISTVSTASLKLCALSERAMSEAVQERELVRAARMIMAEITLDGIPDSGTSGDIIWNFANAKPEIMGDGFGRLKLGEAPETPKLMPDYMELTVKKQTPSGQERSITLYTVMEARHTQQK